MFFLVIDMIFLTNSETLSVLTSAAAIFGFSMACKALPEDVFCFRETPVPVCVLPHPPLACVSSGLKACC